MSVFSALRYPYRGPAGAQACKIYLHDFTILMMVCAHYLLFLSSTIVVRFRCVFGIPMLYISQGDHIELRVAAVPRNKRDHRQNMYIFTLTRNSISSRIVPSSPEPKMHTHIMRFPDHQL